MWKDYSFHRVVSVGITEKVIVEQRFGGEEESRSDVIMLTSSYCWSCVAKHFGNGTDSADRGETNNKAICPDMSPERICWPLSHTMWDPSVREEQPGAPHSHWESKAFCFQDMPLSEVQESLKNQNK